MPDQEEVRAFDFLRKKWGLTPKESLNDRAHTFDLFEVIGLMEEFSRAFRPPQEGGVK